MNRSELLSILKRDEIRATALSMVTSGLRPVFLRPLSKLPAQKQWGQFVHSNESIDDYLANHPYANLGIALRDGLIDVEADGPEAVAQKKELFASIPDDERKALRPPHWESKRGSHTLFRLTADQIEALSSIGAGAIVKTEQCLEFRLGDYAGRDGKQFQSVVPPSITADESKDGAKATATIRSWSGRLSICNYHPPTLPTPVFASLLEWAKSSATADNPEAVAKRQRPIAAPSSRSNYIDKRVRPLDWLASRTSWNAILEPLGWSHLYTDNSGTQRWARPGSAEPSATIGFCKGGSGDGKLYIFSSSPDIAPFIYQRAYSKVEALVVKHMIEKHAAFQI